MDQSAEIINTTSSQARIAQPPAQYKNSKRARLFLTTHNAIQYYELPFLILILCTATFLAIFLFNKPLNLADTYLITDLEYNSLWQMLTNYININGFLHPLGYLLNLTFLTLTRISTPAAHLLLFTIHAISATLLGLLFAKKYTRIESTMVALIYLTFPFLTESFSTFTQANFAFAALILILQLTIIQSDHLDVLVKAVFVTFLQLVGVLIHEQLLFTFIPLLFILMPYDKHLISGQQIRMMLLITFPSFFYLITKLFILPPANKQHLWSIYGVEAWRHVLTLLSSFLDPAKLSADWYITWLKGIKILQSNDIAIIITALLIILIGYELYLFFTSQVPRFQSGPPLVHPFFWLALGAIAFLPFSPEVIGIGLFCLLLASFLFLRFLSKRVTIIVMISLFAILLPICLGIIMRGEIPIV